jgi:deoxyribonuclease V
MKAALDVDYRGDAAIAACVVFGDWQDGEAAAVVRAEVQETAGYRAGAFYERELPCVMAVLEEARQQFEALVIDGYVHLRPDVGKGLGVHLAEALSYSPIIIGVAKNPLRVADRFRSIRRGRSAKPLFVSALGCPLDHAARAVLGMHGPHRIPTLLGLADRCARGAWPAQPSGMTSPG